MSVGIPGMDKLVNPGFCPILGPPFALANPASLSHQSR
jgi:hypothetical protein